jgi:ABC-type lipoprotein export system ATPase subunit
MSDQRGSTWAKWDLHIHSPKTFLENRYANLSTQDFVKELKAKDIRVIGLTNYFRFADNEVEEIVEECNKNGITVFPNLEFRTQPENQEAETMHIHIIFSDKLPLNIINNFLGRLKTIDDQYCKGLSKSMIESTSITLDGLLEKLGEDKEISHLKDYLIAACPRGQGSFRPSQEDDGRGNNIAKVIDEKTDILFGSTGDTEFFLDATRYYKARPKPVVSCCDAHSKTGIGTKFTWIKADPSFEGLKQILYEPRDRVKIQQTTPYKDRSKIFFDSVEISGFKNFKIPNIKISLNRELVSIIGGRGSGKSALLDTIAFLNEEHSKKDANNKSKIIEHYRNNEDNLVPAPGFKITATIISKDGQEKVYGKDLSELDNKDLPFLYIGQEQLSKIATNDKILTPKICDLIGLNVVDDKKSNLVEKARELLSQINIEQAELFDILNRYPDLSDIDFENWLEKLILQKKSQLALLSSKSTKTIIDEISKITQRGIALNELQNSLTQLKDGLSEQSINADIEEINLDIKKLYPSETKTLLSRIDFKKHIDHVDSMSRRITEEVKTLRKKYDDQKNKLNQAGIKEDVTSLLKAAERLQSEISRVEKDLNTLKAKLKTINDLENKRASIFDGTIMFLEEQKQQIDNYFLSFTQSRVSANKDDKDLFERVIKGVGVEGSIEFDRDTFCDHILNNFLDRRTYRTQADLIKVLAGIDESSGKANELSIDSLSRWIKNGLKIFLKNLNMSSDTKAKFLEYLFTSWDHFLGLKAVVKLDGVPTDKLSVGQRGTLLLKIYLATASGKQIFIVDQPEDNLDNAFIMNELVPMIREIKKIRQVILATHNANLVVNTDSEQVLVALLDDEMSKSYPYFGGSIEEPVINQTIQDTLEGGSEAFRQRERRYLNGA